MAATLTEVTAGINGTNSVGYTLTLTNSFAAGDWMMVVGASDTSDSLAAGSITDSADGTTFGTHTWAMTTNGPNEGTSAHRAGIWYALCVTPLVSGVSKIKLTTGGASHKTLQVLKLTPVTSPAIDKVAKSDNQASTASPVTGTTAATTQATELALAMFLYAGSPSFTAPGAYSQTGLTTQQTVTGGGCSTSVCFQFLAATGTQTATASLGTAQTAGGTIATFAYTEVAASAASLPPYVPSQAVPFMGTPSLRN